MTAGPLGTGPPRPAQLPVLVVPVYYDFASSIAYVAHRAMERMHGDLVELGLSLRWKPLDLAALLGWKRGREVDDARRGNALRVASDLGVPLRVPPVWIDSRPAMAVSLCLGPGVREPAWRERVWSAIFEEGRDVGSFAELRRLAREMDLGRELEGELDADTGPDGEPDPEATRLAAALEDLALATRAAAEEGVSGVPTFMLDGWAFGGIQEEATMRSILGRFAEKKRREILVGDAG